VAPRPETRPASGQPRASRDGDRCCLVTADVLIFMLVLLGAAVAVGIWVFGHNWTPLSARQGVLLDTPSVL
jgi:hypothetical protein